MQLSEYHRHLRAQKLSSNTRIAYEHQVAQFYRWLKESQIEFPSDPLARDLTVNQYKRFLRDEKEATTSSINAALTAISNFCSFIGIGEPIVEREKRMH